MGSLQSGQAIYNGKEGGIMTFNQFCKTIVMSKEEKREFKNWLGKESKEKNSYSQWEQLWVEYQIGD